MQVKRIVSMVLVFTIFLGNLSIFARASEITDPIQENFTFIFTTPRATGSFNMTIPAGAQSRANSSFQLRAGETVTINASYAPFSASVDFGLVTPSGTFRYFNITNGSINRTILIEESGNYYFQIRNKSNYEIEVTGFINY